MLGLKQYIAETVGAKGLAYELKVHTAMKTAKVPTLNAGDKPGAGFSNQGAGDIEAVSYTHLTLPTNREV